MNNRIIVNMEFGSHLYGTNTESSDKDYVGVFLPTRKEVLLNRLSKQYNVSTKTGSEKNTKDDVDTVFYGIHYFFKLASEGQTIAMDMLHVPSKFLIQSSDVWSLIVSNRHIFYTKNLTAFIGYARRQASKYGIKGSRLNSAIAVVESLYKYDITTTLKDCWDELPLIEHVHKLDPTPPDKNRLYQVCGKKFQETVRVGYVIPVIEKFLFEYGDRARQAANNKNIDWKAVSHALRAAYQIKELLTKKTITFPLAEAELLKKVKSGVLSYVNTVAPLLETLMEEVELLTENSDLPSKVNPNRVDELLAFIIDDNIINYHT